MTNDKAIETMSGNMIECRIRLIGAGTTFPIKAKFGDVFEHIFQVEEDNDIVEKHAIFIFTGENWDLIVDYHTLEEWLEFDTDEDVKTLKGRIEKVVEDGNTNDCV